MMKFVSFLMAGFSVATLLFGPAAEAAYLMANAAFFAAMVNWK